MRPRRPRTGLADIAGTAQRDMRRSHATRGDAEAFATLFELGVQTATASSVGEALSRIHTSLSTLMPADICAAIPARPGVPTRSARPSVSGAHADAIVGTTMQVGQRLSGWVAANRQTIANSEAALDLGNLAMRLDPPPLRCLSTAICDGRRAVGRSDALLDAPAALHRSPRPDGRSGGDRAGEPAAGPPHRHRGQGGHHGDDPELATRGH